MKLAIIAVSEPTKYPQIFRRFLHLNSLVLPVLASLTPADVSVRLIDESIYIKKPNYEKLRVDLAALSVRTSCANRAYAISDLLRSRGIRTVLGGIHPTILPEESKRHADAVVIGEAEGTWPLVIQDFRRNALKPFYARTAAPDLKNLPLPRRDLLRSPDRAFFCIPTIQTGRGCPHQCTFCSVTKLHGGSYRKRPVKEIVHELRAMGISKLDLRRPLAFWQDKLLFFLDDNLFADRNYARDLLVRLKPFKKMWYTQAAVSLAKDPTLLRLARESGCRIVSLGFDSVVQSSLDQANKAFNQTQFYAEAVKRIHRAGLMVAASMMFGFDEDDSGVFEKTLKFTLESGVDFASFHILTPYPGTPFFDQIMKEGRLLVPPGDWRKFDTQHVVFQPKRMTLEELQEGYHWVWREFTSWRSIRVRARQTANAGFFWPVNLFLKGLFSSSLIKLGAPARRPSFSQFAVSR
jgi:radical SAM superfamily enzyme YgiQ (UPF0313 family)